MSTTQNEFGRFFRKRRQKLGLNLSEFCRQNGFDKGNVSRLERGLAKPPKTPGLLKTYADALQLQPNSEDRKTFMRNARAREEDVEALFRKRLHDSWVKARDLEQWSPMRNAQQGLPTLVRKLIYATTEQVTRIEVAGGEGIQRHGWDGVVEVPTASVFVPSGVSGWEISVEQRPANKAERDFKARKKGPLGLPCSEVTLVLVTSRKWDKKQEWRDNKRERGKWKSVEVYDSSDLEAWLELAPGVDAWIAERLGRRPPGVISISDYWESLSRLCEPRLQSEVFLKSREKTAEKLRAFLLGTPGVLPIECRSPVEAIDFAAAYLATAKSEDTEFAMDEDDRIRAQNRTVIVKDRAQWDGLSQATGKLNLLPIPSLSLTGEELNVGVTHGHRIVIAATQFSNHRLQPVALPRPSRYDLQEALCKAGFERNAADRAARAAGGSLSVLKRHVSTIPSSQLPGWCSETGLADFMPMLLIGAWDDENEVDRAVLSRVSGQTYSELQKVATRLTLVEDAPLTQIASRWRLVSPEDAWSLVGAHVTVDLLRSFETIAIEVLSQSDESLRLTADERLKATLLGELEPSPSFMLRRGVCETTAILGCEFGPAATLPGGQQWANRIVRSVLHNAGWLRWATLSDVLPLLAEAAPEVILDEVSTGLGKKRAELEKVFAHERDNHPLLSGSSHIGLPWALEGLAWSPELLPKVCSILASLAEFDRGQKWAKPPAQSLREILLPWCPQTVARVEKRIAVLKSLADRAPAVAWKLVLDMLPHGKWHAGLKSHAGLTHRPVWRDWMSAWQERPSSADYWKQVRAAADLVLELVGDDLERWFEVLDKLQSVPESHRNQVIERLQNFPVHEIDPEQRRNLVERLRRTIQRHRDFADAWWALPAESVVALEQALSKLRPSGLRDRHAWLFVPWIDLEGFRGNYEGMKTEIYRLRADALREIVNEGGFEGVLKLADIVESPDEIGVTLAQIECVPDDKILPGLLISSDANHHALAKSYARVRIRRAGWGWVRTLGLDDWSVNHAAILLSQAGLDPEAWRLAEGLGKEVFRQYWMTVPVLGGFHLTQEQLEFACERLLEVDRPESALRILSALTHGRVTASASTTMDALAAYQQWRQSNPDSEIRDDVHAIQRLFGWLQETIPFNKDEPSRRLAELEWRYLEILDGFGALPRTLIRSLSEDPKLFAQLIALIFRSEHEQEQESDRKPTEQQQKVASHGYRLLTSWRRVPGIQADGSVDEQQLLQWLDSARELCRESGHLAIADSQIGQMLASWPKPKNEDATWPCEAICDAIEEANSDELDRGFQIGARNSRGATMRFPLDGGDLERKEEAKYRKWAELCNVDWPRTAASLRSVADSYEFNAQREDACAAERAQDRH